MTKEYFRSKNTILKAVLLLFVVVSSILTARDGGDFDVFLNAAQKLNNGQNIYQPPFAKGLQYYYSVFFALVLIPFSYQIFITEVLWSLLSYFLLYRTFKLAQGYFDFSTFTKKQYHTWVILTALLSLQFILYNVAMVQITIFLLWTIFESIHLMETKKNILGGTLLGMAINIKIMPVLILPYLFYRGYFKAFLIAVFTFIALLYLPAVFIGQEYNQFLLSEWWLIINPGQKEHLFETGIGMHSITAMLPVYLTETTGEMDYQRNILNIDPQYIGLIINIARLFILSLSLFYLRSWPFKKENDPLKSYWEISFFVLTIPLLLPHQQKYAFLLAIPMVSYLLYFFIKTFDRQQDIRYRIALYTFVISMLVYSPLYGMDVIGKFLFKFTQHYRVMTFCTLLLIPVSIYCNPKKRPF